jgi:hypothetical protein
MNCKLRLDITCTAMGWLPAAERLHKNGWKALRQDVLALANKAGRIFLQQIGERQTK